MKTEKNNQNKLSKEEKSHRKFLELFPKIKPKKSPTVNANNVKRFHASAREGLSNAQVEERINQGLVNKTGKKQSKTYPGIIFGNLSQGSTSFVLSPQSH